MGDSPTIYIVIKRVFSHRQTFFRQPIKAFTNRQAAIGYLEKKWREIEVDGQVEWDEDRLKVEENGKGQEYYIERMKLHEEVSGSNE